MAEKFRLQIITPERIFYEGEVSFIEIKTTEGPMGIYKNHVPTTLILSPGVLKIYEDEGVKRAALHTGFVEIQQEKIVVMAEIAEWPEEIDVKRAEEARIRAERRIKDDSQDDSVARAEIALRKALARLEASGK